MKNKLNQMLKEKLFLVVLVLGLLTVVAAAGVARMQRNNGKNPYVQLNGEDEDLFAKEEMQNPIAGNSNADSAENSNEDRAMASSENPDTVVAEKTQDAERALAKTEVTEDNITKEKDAVAAGTGSKSAAALVLDFSDTSRMEWPVRGNVILDYNMDSTIYFPTLDQYKCNPGMIIQGDVSDPVYAPANARVLETGSSEEIGNYLKLDLGNDYTAICGQLKEIPVHEGEYLEKGQLMGYVAEPTKYYSIEGSNVFFEVKHEDKTVDPLDYLD